MPGAEMVSEIMESNPDGLDSDKMMVLTKAVDSLNILPVNRAVRCESEFQKYAAAWTYMIDTFVVKAK